MEDKVANVVECTDEQTERLSTGVPGLGEILGGGFIPRRAYLVRGAPGSGKTILGLHFLTAGALQGEPCLFVTLGETEGQIRSNAASLGYSLEGISFLDLSPAPEFFTEDQSYDIFHPAEVEREPITRTIIEQVEAIKPTRVFLDALTQFRYLSTDSLEFHKQAFSFLRYLSESGATVVFTSDSSQQAPDDDLQFMSDGIIQLECNDMERSLCVTKMRGSSFRMGHHTFRLTTRGMEVSPVLVPDIQHEKLAPVFTGGLTASGIAELDALLHGGLDRGTTTVLTGPSGVGKTTVGMQFMKASASRQEKAVVYIFEEGLEALLRRCEAINLAVRPLIESQLLSVVPIEPLSFTADEFSSLVCRDVEQSNARIVMIDSVAGYRMSLRGKDLISHLHALTRYLKSKGVSTILINELKTLSGDFHISEIGISYLADDIIFLRYLELNGELRKAIGVIKKRVGDFEKTLREVQITPDGLKLGEPLTHLRGLLSSSVQLT
jgi:circadian clock protein KaiC